MIRRHFWRHEAGATAIEYAIIVAIMAVAVVAAVSLLREPLQALIGSVVSAISGTSS